MDPTENSSLSGVRDTYSNSSPSSPKKELNQPRSGFEELKVSSRTRSKTRLHPYSHKKECFQSIKQEAGGAGLVSRRFSGPDGAGAGDIEMRIPNDMASVVIGPGGATIRSIQVNSGACIMLWPRVDPSAEWSLYINGTKEQVEAARQLINEVISEEAGGSVPASRTFSGPAGAGSSQIKMRFLSYMAHIIIGVAGKTILSIQANSGARIWLGDGDDPSTDGTFYISGTEEQVEAARQLINEVVRKASDRMGSISSSWPTFGSS